MNRFLLFLTLFCISFSFVGCASVQKRQTAALQKSIYATNDAIKKQRFDLAKKYSEESVKLLPPPKTKVKIESFNIPYSKDVNGKVTEARTVAVLPSEVKKENILIEDTPEYKQVLEANKVLAKQVIKENEEFEKHKSTVDKILIDKEKELEKLRNEPGFFSKLFSISKWGIISLIIGGIALIFFFPAAIPFVLSLLRLVGRCFNYLVEMCKSLLDYLESKVPK